MSMMLIDQTKDSACKTAEADAIRAKTGGSAQLAYDWANNKGFAEAIAAIPTGGGGSAEKLLGSGTYTVSATANSATISTGITNSDTTKPVKILVVKDSKTSGVGQMLWWASSYLTGPDDFVNKAGANFPKAYYENSSGTGGYCNYQTGSTTNAICYFTRSTGNIAIRQYSNNYKVQPDTFHWYVWGEEATS
jgi:hypothetical protein